MKKNVPDPSLQITNRPAIVENLTSKDPLLRHRLHAVTTENNLHGLVRQRPTLEFWSYLVAEVREREFVIAGDVRVAAMIQRDAKKASNAGEIECEYFMKDGRCRQGCLCPNKHVRLLPNQEKCHNCSGIGHRTNDCSRPKRTQQKETTEKRDFQKPKVAQVLEVTEESERESVSKMRAATDHEILGEPEPNVSVKTQTFTDGILGMRHAAQECDNGRWIWADTGATHEPVRRSQQVLDHVSCSCQLVMSRAGPVLMV